MREIVYIIGHRSADSYRIRNLLLVLKWLLRIRQKAKEDSIRLTLVVVEQDARPTMNLVLDDAVHYMFLQNAGQYNRGWAFNAAVVEFNRADFYFFSDNDIVIPSTSGMLDMLCKTRHFDAVSPYATVYDTKPELFEGSEPFRVTSLGNRTVDHLKDVFLYGVRPYTCLSGGIVGLSNRAFKQVSGWDERFRGRGWEDYAMTAKIRLFLEKVNTFPLDALHLWHPFESDATDRENNRALNEEYSHYTAQDYINLILNTQNQIGCRNKYTCEILLHNCSLPACKHCCQCPRCFHRRQKDVVVESDLARGYNIYAFVLERARRNHPDDEESDVIAYSILSDQHDCGLCTVAANRQNQRCCRESGCRDPTPVPTPCEEAKEEECNRIETEPEPEAEVETESFVPTTRSHSEDKETQTDDPITN